jgi:hypothetical protein
MRHVDKNIEQKIFVSSVIKKTKTGLTPRKPEYEYDLVENSKELNKLKSQKILTHV